MGRLLAAAAVLVALAGCGATYIGDGAGTRVLAGDVIPAIVQPAFDSPAAVRGLVRPDDLVVGAVVEGRAHAYPIDLLSLHEVVNDGPVVVTWCPLCQSALAFDRRVRGRTLTFGVGGLLHANQLLYDRQSGSRWSQLLGRAISGRYRGTRLRPVPLAEVTYAQWLRAHPDTLVLSIRRDPDANRFLHPYSYADFRGEELSSDPYLAYRQKVNIYYRTRVGGLAGATLVLGVRVGRTAKAYPLQLLHGPVSDVVAGRRLRIVPDPDALSAAVFSGGRRLPSTPVYWFAWRAFFPHTLVYRVTSATRGRSSPVPPPAGRGSRRRRGR
ncbi:MAG: DUF3179 domain-containing protein [Acidobacteriota bacterium]|nr:DUF3179 domain-containing protein [Acidobacteriota bacterium]